MLSPKYFLYLALNPDDQPKLALSSNPKVDAWFLNQSGFTDLYILQPPLPLWIAELVLQKLVAVPSALNPDRLLKTASRVLTEILPLKFQSLQHHSTASLQLPDFEMPDWEELLTGRALLLSEIPDLLKSSGCDLPWDPEVYLQALYVQGKVNREAAVTMDALGLPYCRRCGSTMDIYESNCLFCGSNRCFTCQNCQTMGLAKSCLPLYSKPASGKFQNPALVTPDLEFELTPPQQRAAAAAQSFLDSGQPRFMVWAVCGAGKTEVSFQAIATVLSRGERVLFAIPRKDVVVELLPRFQKAFPGVEIAAQFGGSGERFPTAQLVIATTHQCLRFYQSFDLVVLDEADAFPYQGSAMLHYAVQRSLKPEGRLIIMTATPDHNLIKSAESNKLPYISIPARHHRKPLPVPDLVRLELKEVFGGKHVYLINLKVQVD